MTPDLEAAIQQFAERNPEMRNWMGGCIVASREFYWYLKEMGIKAEIWEILISLVTDHRWYQGGSEVHTVVYVESVVVDWTARQYDLEAPWPLVYHPLKNWDAESWRHFLEVSKKQGILPQS